MEYLRILFMLFFEFAAIGIHGTKGQSVFFTSWEEPPIDSGMGRGNASVVVKENGTPGTSTGIKLKVLGGTGNISYILQQDNPQHFAIGGPANDEVTVVSPVDYEKLKEVTVTVIAFDEGNPQKTGSAIMTIFIGDVNDNAPVFERKIYDVTISELADLGRPFTTVSATDADGSLENNKLSYSIKGGNKENTFEIDSTFGNISLIRQLVYSKVQHYTLTVIAVDAGIGPHALTATTTVMINVTEVNTFSSWKQPPISRGIGHGTATVKVKENGKPGTSTGIKLQALGGNGTILYTIIDQGQHNYFSIGGPDRDDVIVVTPVDFEAQRNVTLVVQAEDSGLTPKTGRATMTILIDDVNDNAPVFQQTRYQISISEKTNVGTELLTVNAIDNDGTSPNNDVTYSLSGGNTNGDFSISPKTGVITVARAFKETRTSVYQLEVRAVDGGTDPRPMSGSTEVSVTINRADDTTTTVTTVSTTKPSGADSLLPCLFTTLLCLVCLRACKVLN
ncbi:cadherin EGF LAG seven-pass G-type receptor 1-like [Mercenaria mercenaria]|uniref:cadherin EGF LAG seven-pass G-type receptor 1-like n=1 Tax=Mercenaria mercenaria TaxID=6596 RepID=UPI00234F4E35|nr:cadherin EGF LAG seven-pass G-type receptor 1-like [Mercenaria mercenaria]